MTPIVGDVTLGASIIAKVTVTMALTLAGVRLARKCPAALRHVWLAAAFAVSLALPVLSIIAPSAPLIDVPIVVNRITQPPSLPSSLRGSLSTANPVRTVPRGLEKLPLFRASASTLLYAGWAVGALLFLLPVLIGLWQVRTLRRFGRTWQHGESLVRQLAADAGIRRRVDLLLHEGISGPAGCGLMRPTVMLPPDAQTWKEDDLRRAIIHELEHIRRGDWVSQCITRVVCACYWFHPLVWMAWRQFALEAERACDDAVLRSGEPTAYADQLVMLAERMSTAPKGSLLPMANRTHLKTRVVAVLDHGQQRGRASRLSVALACVASTLLVTMLSPLRIVLASQNLAGTQNVAGSLMDPVGQPVPEATLTLLSSSTQRRMETETDQDGRFTFSGIQAGEYSLQVQKFGFAASQQRITLKAGRDLNRTIELQVAGIDDTVAVYSKETPAALPPPPLPLSPNSNSTRPYMAQADLDRCAQASMFCRIMPPHKIADAQPIYPTKQRENQVAGEVIVAGRIGRDGLIKDLRTLAPADPDFARATFDALRRWQFTPTQLDGVPIEVTIRVTADFVVQ